MALPEDFSPWEHLHTMLLNAFNLNVEQTFFGVASDDISTTLGGMKLACLMQADDTVDMTLLRLMLYYWVFKNDLPTPVYGIPIPDGQAEVSFRPQVTLFFREKYSTFLTENKLPRASMQISYKLMNYTSATINPSVAVTIGNSIKEFFAVPPYMFEKGVNKYVYRDVANGYFFRILGNSEGDAIALIERIFEVSGGSFDETKMSVATPKKSYPVVPSQVEVYGKEVSGKRIRPITEVYFTHAELHIDGLTKPISLVDLRGLTLPLVH